MCVDGYLHRHDDDDNMVRSDAQTLHCFSKILHYFPPKYAIYVICDDCTGVLISDECHTANLGIYSDEMSQKENCKNFLGEDLEMPTIGTTGRVLDLQSTGRGFESYSRQSCITTSGKLLTPMCLWHQAV